MAKRQLAPICSDPKCWRLAMPDSTLCEEHAPKPNPIFLERQAQAAKERADSARARTAYQKLVDDELQAVKDFEKKHGNLFGVK